MNKVGHQDQLAAALLVQADQLECGEVVAGAIDQTLCGVAAEQARRSAALDAMISAAQGLSRDGAVSEDGCAWPAARTHTLPDPVDFVPSVDDLDWQAYWDAIQRYAGDRQISIDRVDPYRDLMSASQRAAFDARVREEFEHKASQCDPMDYMLAGACGLLGGLVDVFAVGNPGNSRLLPAVDGFADRCVERFAKFSGWKGPAEGSDSTASAIGFLERKYKVNYDHPHGGATGHVLKMSTKNHHIKSLGHSPDLVGLFFSLLDQFTNQAHFVSDGRLIRINTENFELSGSTLAAKVFCGFVNWLGHLFSDMAGSSGAQGRGSGIPIPFFSLLQFVNVGEFGQHRQSFATICVRVFEEGYDLRFGAAMAIPVALTECLVRVMWVVRQRFVKGRVWGECVPSGNVPELRRMLLVGHGTLVIIDVTHAGIRSGGEPVIMLCTMNLVAWVRFGTVALKEANAMCRAGTVDAELANAFLDQECARLLRSCSA